jgi:hypothetical protein
MSKWKFIFLALALTGIAFGFSDARPATFLDLGRPMGETLLGLLLVAQLLERASALQVKQIRAAVLTQNEPIRTPMPSKYSRNEVATHPVPTTAHTH